MKLRFKIVTIALLSIMALGVGTSFSYAAPATPKHQCKTSADCGKGSKCVFNKQNVRVCQAGFNCKKAGSGLYKYDLCKGANGITELRNYTCEMKDSAGNTSTVRIPVCTVGGIFNLNDPDDIKCACCGQCPLSRFLGLFITISKWVLGLSGTAALAVIVYGGFMWILSGGDPKKIETGKNALTGAVIGVIIVLGAWLMVNEGLKAMTGKGIDAIQAEFKANLK